jgi:hypothetical protein
MLHGIHCATMMSILVTLAALPHSATAQGSDESGDGRSMADEGKKGNGGRAQSDDRKRNDSRNDRGSSDRRGNDSRPTQGPLAVPSRVNEAFTYPIGNGCQYSATIRGSVKAARSGGSEEPRYSPNLTVNAWVTCQNNTELRVTDNTLKDTAMTRSQLEQAIEMRGSLLAESSGKRCVYLPDFNLGDGRLTGVGVSFLCPTASSSSSLADNQDGSGRVTDDDSNAAVDNRPANNDAHNHDNSHDRGSSDRRNDRDRDNGRDRKGYSSDDNQ